jgi:asparagine synthase (glutamine-hydrolysing)
MTAVTDSSEHHRTDMPAARERWLSGRPRLEGRPIDADELAARVDARGPSAVLSELDGPFALALTLADGSLLLAVDRFAMQSLCWRQLGRVLHHAPRADSLGHLEPRAAIDQQALFDYLHFHAIPSPRTAFVGVHRLPPAHYALVPPDSANDVQISRYWTPSFSPDHGGSDVRALAEEFRRLLRLGVERELDGGIPACFLSGGTDSSTVAGMIREVTGQGAEGFSIGFEAAGYDEMAYARIAAKAFGVRHHEYYVTPDDLVRSIPLAAAHHDQPFGNSSVVPAFHCALQARERGVTRMLAGDGGDELFGGNSRYAKQRVFGWYQALPASMRRGLLEPLLNGPAGSLPLLRKGRSYIEQAGIPMPSRLDLYNLIWRIGLDVVLTPELLARIDRSAPSRQQVEIWNSTPAASELDRNLAFDWRYTLADNDLPKVMLAAGQAGIGVGFPLLDRELVEFSTRLPARLKLRGLRLRWFFKEALRSFLPDEIIRKKKHGFGLPFGVWAVGHAELHALARDSLSGLAKRGVVRPAFVEQLFGQLLPAHPGYYGEMVWILMMLEQWLRKSDPGFEVR